MRGDVGIAPYEGVYKQYAKLQFAQQNPEPFWVPGEILFLFSQPVIFLQHLDCLRGHGDDGDHVEDRHQTDADVA